MGQQKPFEVREADVWIDPNGAHRRVIAILGGAVAYSVGADTNRMCKLETFRRFTRSATLEFRKAD